MRRDKYIDRCFDLFATQEEKKILDFLYTRNKGAAVVYGMRTIYHKLEKLLSVNGVDSSHAVRSSNDFQVNYWRDYEKEESGFQRLDFQG
jgi:hypothetical protein